MRRVAIWTAILLGNAGLAFADAPPAGARPEAGVQASSPYWNPQQPASDLPATDIRVVPGALANSTRAYWTYQQTQTDLNNAIRLTRRGFERDPAFIKAKADEQAAWDDLQKARAKALENLNNNANYTGSAMLHQNLTTQISDEAAAAKPDQSRITAMAWLKLQYIRDNRRLENAVLDQDQAYQDARKRYVEIAGRVTKMRDDQSWAIATDGTLTTIRQRLADARIEKTTANAYYLGTVEARRLALRYAYFYRGVDLHNPYSPYGLYGGGYGYGYGGYGYRY